MWTVYILLCQDQSMYTGYSNNLEKRINLHKAGKGAKYTRSHKVVKLIYQESFETKLEALKREREIKNLSRDKKIKLLNLSF